MFYTSIQEVEFYDSHCVNSNKGYGLLSKLCRTLLMERAILNLQDDLRRMQTVQAARLLIAQEYEKLVYQFSFGAVLL